jgi:2-dehydro-3-deoxyphosphogluconate aldolase/(4S)-4-hydroxy-2-oxoglutarate aldolase
MSDLARALEPRVVPVVVIDDPATAVPLAAALEQAGITTAEITLRTDSALEAIRLMSASSSLVVGAGTVRSASEVDAVVDAGARYVVSPGFSPAVVERCHEHGIAVLPGIATATEAMAAASAGVDLVKFFPAEANGGVRALAALAAALPGTRFVPTGGISDSSLASYLALPSVAACGGSWMVAPALLAAGDFAEVRRLSAAAVAVGADGRAGAVR